MLSLPESQEALLLKLKQKGPQTVRALAEHLSISTMGVRQHLAGLQAAGLVQEGEEEPQARGRPVRPWRLTQAGHQRFPDSHSLIAVELIASVRETLGESVLDQLIDKRGEQILALYQREMLGKKSLKARLQALVNIRSREGYMAELEKSPEGHWLLIENHCPICAAAKACQGFCRSELEIFRAALGPEVRVERTDHLLMGARRCAYKVQAL